MGFRVDHPSANRYFVAAPCLTMLLTFLHTMTYLQAYHIIPSSTLTYHTWVPGGYTLAAGVVAAIKSFALRIVPSKFFLNTYSPNTGGYRWFGCSACGGRVQLWSRTARLSLLRLFEPLLHPTVTWPGQLYLRL